MPRVPPAQYIGHSTLDFPFFRSFTTLPFCNHTTCHMGLTDFFFHGKSLSWPYTWSMMSVGRVIQFSNSIPMRANA